MPRIILDTDPGIDDALALFLALASPELQIEAITSVNGNVGIDWTTRNALTLLELAGRSDIPVARGCAQPLVRQIVDAAEVHGNSGLGRVELPEPKSQVVPQHAVDLIVEKIMQSPGEITLVAVGPLTNLAMALRKEPRIAQNVRDVYIMGGALRIPGNVTPAAEFNIYVDPEASHVVFRAGWPIHLVSLDATHQVPVKRDEIEALTRQGGKVKAFIREMMDYYYEYYGPKYNTPVFHMHDPLCLASVFQPDLVTWEPAFVDVELTGTLTLGETVAYFPGPDAPTPNAQVSVGADREGFMRLFTERIVSAFA